MRLENACNRRLAEKLRASEVHDYIELMLCEGKLRVENGGSLETLMRWLLGRAEIDAEKSA